jgi:sugar phosphate isomerase/epimerase
MKNTKQNLVWCEMDTYWVAKSGADPVAILRRYSGRYLAIHVKDMANDDERSIACAGEGVLDFAPILAEAVSQGVEHFIVERERVQDGMKCLEVSARHLRSLFN